MHHGDRRLGSPCGWLDQGAPGLLGTPPPPFLAASRGGGMESGEPYFIDSMEKCKPFFVPSPDSFGRVN